jgi:hypothetical protein
MKTIPALITEYSSLGGRYAFLIDIFPRGSDGWPQKRYASFPFTVGGNAYEIGIIKSLTQLSQQVEIENGGAAEPTDSVTVRLSRHSELHEEIALNTVDGRRLTISVAAVPFNRILNSSFENYSAGPDFDSWTEAGAGLQAVTAFSYDNATCCQVAYNAGASSILSDPITWKRGEYISISWWMYVLATGTSNCKMIIKCGGLWWNIAADQWDIGVIKNSFNNAAATTWERHQVILGWHELPAALRGASVTEQDDLTIQFLCEDSGHVFYVDGVQVEPLTAPSTYHPHASEMATADIFRRFTGIIREPGWDADEVILQVESIQSDAHGEIPITVVDEDTFPSNSIPEESYGLAVPMRYGAGWGIAMGNLFYPSFPVPLEQTGNLARGVLLDVDDPEVIFDRPGMALGDAPDVWHYDKKSGEFYEQIWLPNSSPVYEWVGDAANAKATMAANSPNLAEKKAPFRIMGRCLKITTQTGTWSGMASMLDGSCATYENYSGAAAGHSRFIIKQQELDDAAVIGAYFVGDIDQSVGSGGPPSVDARFWGRYVTYGTAPGSYVFINAAGQLWKNTPWGRGISNPMNQLVDAIPVTLSTRTDNVRKITEQLVLDLHVSHVGMTGSPLTNVYEFGILIDFTVDILKVNFCSDADGREFQDQWDARKGAGVTIQKAWDIIESILRHERGQVGTDINLASFDAVDAASPALQTSRGVQHEFADSLDVVDKICKEFGLLYFTDFSGLHSIASLAHGSPVASLTKGDFLKASCKYTPADKAKNNIRVNYRKNQFTGEYRLQAFCHRNGNNIGSASYQTKCGTSYTALGAVENKFEINCDWIGHDSAAFELVKWVIDWAALPRLIVRGEIGMEWMGLEIGDLISIDLPGYIPHALPSDSVYIITETRLKLRDKRIGIVAMEVKAP